MILCNLDKEKDPSPSKDFYKIVLLLLHRQEFSNTETVGWIFLCSEKLQQSIQLNPITLWFVDALTAI